ncbi:MAG: UbiA family prenyltransferase [Chloroflexota bacterium]|nr:UbiA family prenyltransferase [Chloroflexota bacterium]
MRLLRRLQGYWLMIHPFPVMMVVAFATILAVASARETTDLSRLVRAIATLFFSQAVVGITNDYHDRALDAQGQPWKPLARGIVSPNEARVLIALAFLLMLTFAISLGPIVLLLALLGTIAGIIYNFWLRGTPFSWLPYVLGFIVLPISVWVSMQSFNVNELALVPIGLPLLVGVHLAQTLPDVETDRALGERGFAVTLGRARGVLAVWSACIAAQLLALLSAVWLNSNLQIVMLTILASFALVAASIALYHRRPTLATLRVIFRLVAPSAVILVAGWLAALQSLGR